MPEGEMNVRTEHRGATVIVAPEGDVDLARSPALREALKKAQADRPERVVVNLEGVEYMDSSGVATLVEALQAARRTRSRMVLCGLQDRVRSIFEIARLDTVFSISGSLDEALQD
jgi:anti-sigma B factor antagonist